MMPDPASNNDAEKSVKRAISKQPKTQSIYQRLKFTASSSSIPSDPPPSNQPDIGPSSSDTQPIEPKSVHSLKQFWYSAFGSVRSRQRRQNRTPYDTDSRGDRTRKCATLSAVSASSVQQQTTGRVASIDCDSDVRKCSTLHRNFVHTVATAADDDIPVTGDRTGEQTIEQTSDDDADANSATRRSSNASNPVENFYKYKTADMVRQQSIMQQLRTPPSPMAVSSLGSDKPANRIEGEKPSTDNANGECGPDESDCISRTSDVDSTDKSLRSESNESTSNGKTQNGTDSPALTRNTAKARKPPLGATSSSSSGSGVTRKCSFRTNAYSRKTGTGGGGSANATGSKVAALTMRFNQLSNQQQARDLLIKDGDEALFRKPGGVIVHRAGSRVFRVIKEEGMLRRSDSRSSADSSPVRAQRKRASVKRRESKRLVKESKAAAEEAPAETIAPVAPTPAIAKVPLEKIKPKIPDKSAQVLQRTKEIAQRRQIVQRQFESSKPIDNLPKPTPLHELVEEVTQLPNTFPPTPVNPPVPLSPPSSPIEDCPKKNKYTRLYEKFRPSFLKSQLHQNRFSKSNSTSPMHSAASSPSEEHSVQKIIDAISTASQRIENLSKSESCLLAAESLTAVSISDDFNEVTEDELKPNQSFLYRSAIYSDVPTSGAPLVEAINKCVLTKAQSMDEMRFRRSFRSSPIETVPVSQQPKTEPTSQPTQQTEDDYEIIQPPEVEVSASELFAKAREPVVYASPKRPTKINLKTSSTDTLKPPQPLNDVTDCSDIYASIAEVFNQSAIVPHTSSASQLANADTSSVNSYESYDTYQTVDEQLLERIRQENGYEICAAPPDPPPEPPPPRQCGGVSGELPALPAPKRRAVINYELQPSESTASSNYEHIKYDKQPPRPPKSGPLPPQPLGEQHLLTVDVQPPATSSSTDPSSPDTEYEEENIYDTIKPRRRPLAPTNGQPPAPPQLGIDYESIASTFMRPKRGVYTRGGGGPDSDSMSTLSSDNKTNSLYGTAMSRRDSVSTTRPPSIGTDGDNSDDWVDMSDGEDDEVEGGHRDRFVVVCERKRGPRNAAAADWSRKVRDQRQQQQQQTTAVEYYEDDSDHYYESLDPTGAGHPAEAAVAPPSSSCQPTESIYDRLPSLVKRAAEAKPSGSAPLIEEDYDSFDSEDESDEEVRIKTDSGVDVSNNRLPDPPAPTNQVYAFMQKIRNFGSLSKNLSKFSKKKPIAGAPSAAASSSSSAQSAQLSPATSSQIYENTQFYVKTPFASGKTKSVSDDAYENTEFHSPRSSKSPSIVKLDQLVLPAQPAASEKSPIIEHIRTFGRKKTSTTTTNGTVGKSFKSKFRKSLGAEQTAASADSSLLSGQRATFYVTDSADLDSGVFTNPPTNVSDETIASSPTASSEQVDKTPPAVISPEVSQRKSSLTVRPLNPPPPPPVDRRSSTPNAANAAVGKSKRPRSSTSWYAECSVFKPADESVEADLSAEVAQSNAGPTSTLAAATTLDVSAACAAVPSAVSPNSSWYADGSDAYQTTSGASVASSSGSSGVSTGGSGDDHSHSMFLNEPLYQIYSAAKLESISHDIEMDADAEHSDGYEEVGANRKSTADDDDDRPTRRAPRPTALQLVGPRQGPSRTLWCEIPEVINSQILSTLTATEKRLQEAKFEILTSEASYLKSLSLLRTHFMNHPAFRDATILSAADRKTLFSYMVAVQECSDRLLCDLENCWQDNIMLLGLSHSVHKHAEKYFHVYVAYCEHQAKLDRTLKRLKENKASSAGSSAPAGASFYQTLCQLESDPVCCGLSLHSFLMLPMQRITRLPLLVDAVVGRLRNDGATGGAVDDEYDSWNRTLALVQRIVGQCNEAANRSAQAYELQQIGQQIEFPQSIRPLPIVPVGTGKLAHRALVRSGALTHIVWRGDDGKLTFGKRFSRTQLHAFLFTDLLVLARRRDSGGRYAVVDYCERQLLTVTSGDVIPQLPTKDVPQAGKHLVCMTLLENHEGKMVEMIFACPSETDRQRWLNATEPPASDNPDEKLYEQWDCPQVMAKHPYVALQPDELQLDGGDVVNVTRKMADGWYQGERLRDGVQGWFPGNYTEEVASAHVRARNLKQRYRLITAAYWEAQKQKK